MCELLRKSSLSSPSSPLLQQDFDILFPSVVVSLSLILLALKLPNQEKGMFLGLSVCLKASATGGF